MAKSASISPAVEAGRFLATGIGGAELDSTTLALLEEVRPLGVVLFARNLPTTEAVLSLTEGLKSCRGLDIIAVDHEGGRVDRMPEGFTRFPPPLEIAGRADPGLVREVGRAQARELRAAGFNVNFAPVVDVLTNPANPVIGDRAFGTTPEMVIHNAIPYMQGLVEGGILGCPKHFPGHGDTEVDSHLDLPKVSHDLRRLRDIELRPFAKAIAQGARMIMVAHIVCESLDNANPVTLSPTVIEQLLRGHLDFDGVAIADDLEMQAITDHHEIGEAAVAAVNAGCDMLLVCQTTEAVAQVHATLTRAIEKGEIARARLDSAERRRQKLLKRIARLGRGGSTDRSAIGASEHKRLAERLIPALALATMLTASVAMAGQPASPREVFLAGTDYEVEIAPPPPPTEEAAKEPDHGQEETPAASSRAKAPDGPWLSLQVGAFRHLKAARQLKEKLSENFSDVYISGGDSGGKPLYRVRVGKFQSEAALARDKQKLRAAGHPSFRIQDKR